MYGVGGRAAAASRFVALVLSAHANVRVAGSVGGGGGHVPL